MFLFTTPSAAPREGGSGNAVVDAIRSGADRTGTSFDYLLATARRESALDPAARAPNSSATGLFQFIEQTWLSVVKQAGPGFGLGRFSDTITARPNGTLSVEDPAARQAVLDLRKDPAVASAMAGVLTGQNRDSLQAALGREPKAGDLYTAHVLGARGAADLIRTAATNPDRPAFADFPDAAAANRGIFYDRSGRARSAAEVYGVLGAGEAAPATVVVSGAASAREDVRPTPPGPGLTGLFQTGRASPVSDAVARIWKVNTGGGSRAAGQAGSFFPRSDEAGAGDGLARAASESAAELASLVEPFGPAAPVPLPPPRPAAASRGMRS